MNVQSAHQSAQPILYVKTQQGPIPVIVLPVILWPKDFAWSVLVQLLVRTVPVNVPVTSATLRRVRRLMARVTVMPGGKGSTVPTTS